MFHSITTKTKILIPMFLLTFILILIGGVVTFINYSNISSLEKLNEKTIFSKQVSLVLHTLQKERGLSCAYVVNKNNQFTQALFIQRTISTSEIKTLQNNLKVISSKSFQKTTRKLLKRLNQLQKVREEIDVYYITYDGVIKFYSEINSILLDILINVSKESHVPLITQNILAYTHLLYFKEYMGIERAEGVTIFSQKKLHKKSLIRFSNVLSLEEQSKTMFLKYASQDMKQFLKSAILAPSFTQISSFRDTLLYSDISKSNITAREWFDTITDSLNTLDKVASFIEKETTKNIQLELESLYTIFTGLTILILSSIVIFIMMLIAFFKLAREEQRLRIVMDKYIISSTTDLKGKIIDVSEAFCTISGYKKEELIGKSHNIVRHPDMPKETFSTMWYSLSRGYSWRGKVKNKRKDGSFYWVYANVEPLFNSSGNVDSYVSIRLDITESELLLLKVQEEEEKNKFQEEMIREQSRLVQMGEMISMIAHQWRQPLSAIAAASGSLQLKAKRNKLDQSTAIEIADKIKGFSMHLSSTIDDFRNFFKTNKTKTMTDFNIILKSVLSIIEGSLEKHKIELNIEVKNIQSFNTFENELKQVILNLIKNAEDALVENKIEKPQIKIVLKESSFTITDNAGGIKEDIISKIFDPYFSTKTKKDGTGLGLYMSKMIVQDHCRGQITASNVKDGAQFQITLGDEND